MSSTSSRSSSAQNRPRDDEYFRDLVYGRSHQRRFTQDSPILPDVFVHYGIKQDDVDNENQGEERRP